mmetsp:Transcript_88083/g.269511  ORF Transcript_88083/g.269511 Transcript_88083/m.269511 type:complete len:204 (+) Transcript_88083:2127-2738(+)
MHPRTRQMHSSSVPQPLQALCNLIARKSILLRTRASTANSRSPPIFFSTSSASERLVSSKFSYASAIAAHVSSLALHKMSMKTCSSHPIHFAAPASYNCLALSSMSSGISPLSSRSNSTNVSIHFPYHFLPKPPVSFMIRSTMSSPSNDLAYCSAAALSSSFVRVDNNSTRILSEQPNPLTHRRKSNASRLHWGIVRYERKRP